MNPTIFCTRTPRRTLDIESKLMYDEAVGQLLETYAENPTAALLVDSDRILLTAEDTQTGSSIDRPYLLLVPVDEQPREEFLQLTQLADVMRSITDWGDGSAETVPTLPLGTNGYQVVVPEDRSTITRVTASCLAAQWLIGRNIDWKRLDDPFFPSALYLATMWALTKNRDFEGSLRSVLGA